MAHAWKKFIKKNPGRSNIVAIGICVILSVLVASCIGTIALIDAPSEYNDPDLLFSLWFGWFRVSFLFFLSVYLVVFVTQKLVTYIRDRS